MWLQLLHGLIDEPVSLSRFEPVDAITLRTADATVDTVTLNLENLGFTNYVTTAGTAIAAATDKLVLDKMVSGATVVVTAAGDVTAAVKDAATATADVVNVVLSSTNNLAAGTFTSANVETINISTIDTEVVVAPNVQTKNVDSLTLTADKATTVNATGAADLTLTMTGSTAVTLIDGSSMTGNLTVTSLNVTGANAIKGGAGADVLTGSYLTALTGGAGKDTFVLNVPTNVNTYSSVLDFSSGDAIDLDVANGGTVVFKQGSVCLRVLSSRTTLMLRLTPSAPMLTTQPGSSSLVTLTL